MMEKFYASKENCDLAQRYLASARSRLTGIFSGVDAGMRMFLELTIKEMDQTAVFLEAARKRLPMHSSYVRSEQNRRKRAKEQVNADG
jgi:hypothetical protein